MRICTVCGRSLHEDSRYCDFCGTKIPEETQPVFEQKTLNTNLLYKWIFISLLITVMVTLIAHGAGIPLIFGGFFLPFFFKKKKINS